MYVNDKVKGKINSIIFINYLYRKKKSERDAFEYCLKKKGLKNMIKILGFLNIRFI